LKEAIKGANQDVIAALIKDLQISLLRECPKIFFPLSCWPLNIANSGEIMAALEKPLLCGPRNECWIVFEYGGDDRNPSSESAVAFAENQAARMKIVQALGGNEAVQKIAEIAYPILVQPEYLADIRSGKLEGRMSAPATGYMNELEGIAFPNDVSIVQTEDPAGRKALVLKIVRRDSPENLVIETIFQRRRETCIFDRDRDGICWISKKLAPDQAVDSISTNLDQLMRGVHPEYILKV
jgi:hypothetical protein